MKHRFQTVIFDFDYTLADSSGGIIDSVNFALQALNLPTASAEEIKLPTGPGWGIELDEKELSRYTQKLS